MIAGETGVVDQLRHPDGVAEAAPLVVAGGGDDDGAVGGLVLAGGAAAAVVAGTQRDAGGQVLLQVFHQHQRGQSVHHGDIQVGALAGLFLVAQRGQYGGGGEHWGNQVANVETDAGGRAVRLAVDVHQAAHALDLRVVGGLLGVRAGLPVAGDAGVDDAGVDGGNVSIAQSESGHGAGGQVFQQNVGLARHLQEQIPTLRVFQVQSNAFDALAALEKAGSDVIGGRRVGYDAVGAGERAVAAHGVAPTGQFHFDDLGAKPGQGHTQKGAGQKDGNGQNPQIAQRLHINPRLVSCAENGGGWDGRMDG